MLYKYWPTCFSQLYCDEGIYLTDKAMKTFSQGYTVSWWWRFLSWSLYSQVLYFALDTKKLQRCSKLDCMFPKGKEVVIWCVCKLGSQNSQMMFTWQTGFGLHWNILLSSWTNGLASLILVYCNPKDWVYLYLLPSLIWFLLDGCELEKGRISSYSLVFFHV